MSSLLTSHRHIIGYSLPYDGVEDITVSGIQKYTDIHHTETQAYKRNKTKKTNKNEIKQVVLPFFLVALSEEL